MWDRPSANVDLVRAEIAYRFRTERTGRDLLGRTRPRRHLRRPPSAASAARETSAVMATMSSPRAKIVGCPVP